MAEIQLERQKIYDPVQRILHWLLAACVLILGVTGWGSELFEKGLPEKTVWMIHIQTGYVLTIALFVRVIWGFIGPKHARWSSFFHVKEWIKLSKNFSMRMSGEYGHHPLASLAYLGFYLILAGLSLSGIALAAFEHSTGPLAQWLSDRVNYEEFAEEPHELLAFATGLFVFIHASALILHERLEGIPLAQAMVSGFQYRKKQLAFALVLLGTVLGSATPSHADTPQSLLQHYAKEAGASSSAVFSAERGKKMFFAERKHSTGKSVSCTECHTSNPRGEGKTRLNKIIKPIAPSANPERFTQLSEVEKWFRRNCQDVLERTCTPQEKGDFIQFMITQ